MRLQTPHAAPPRKEHQLLSSPSSRRTDDGSVDAIFAGVGAAAYYYSTEPLGWRKFRSLLLVSITLSSIFIIDGQGGGGLFVDALDSPTAPYRGVGASPNSDESTTMTKRDNDNRSEMIGDNDRAETKIIQTILHKSEEEDSNNIRNNDNTFVGENEDSSTYEPKSQKQFSSSSNNHRQQRQKQRLMQRQKQQEQQPATTREQNNREQQQQQKQHSSQAEHDAYMHWCEKVLGIQSVVEIKEFEYLDHLQIHWYESDGTEEYGSEKEFDWLKQYLKTTSVGDKQFDDYGEDSNVVELPTKPVRGIAAKHDIQVGDIVISIPLYSLLSVPTTIDHDPVLSRILGPDARHKLGWTNTAEYEIALLVIAVLYHRELGKDSPLSHYIDILLGTPTDSFPFLWSDEELREKTGGDIGEGVRTLARGIRQDLYELYDGVIGTLVKKRPEAFAPPDGYDGNQSGEGGGKEWIYSYENFQWAFALVISRHHYLPIQDFDDEDERARPLEISAVKNTDFQSQMQETLSTVSEVFPPANQPTDSWVDLAKNEERVVEEDDLVALATDDDVTLQSLNPMRHSFLAPLADLINFGPPCLIGSYNAEEHVFELIATCPFTKGQEVTFYYSSDCSDVIIANFGFLHPLVPQCAAPEDWEKKSDEWKEKTKMREKELWEVYRKVDLLKDELAILESQLVTCECEDGEKKKQHQHQQLYSMPTASSSIESNHKLRKDGQHHSLRQDIGVRGRMNEQAQITEEMMEELG
ncbi:hypothetical protein ACHAXR_006876 [Thalassiosira sp. AJA248-18]